METELVKPKTSSNWQDKTLIANDLTINRGDLQLCSKINFSVASGQILHIQGPNGIGKTTLLMMLAGLLPTADIRRENRALDWVGTITSDWPVLYIGHLAGLNAGLSVRENLFFLQSITIDSDEHSDANLSSALDIVGLSGYEDVAISHLSSGQKRRVSLARLWLNNNSDTLWLLDEPLNSLDTVMTMRLTERLVQHAERGGRVILTSHQALMLSVQTLNLEQFALAQNESDGRDCEYSH